MSVRPRHPRGPHLNALRAFEAAARLESFVSAAEELGVTPGAVSQHVKAVETWAGASLFVRHAQGVSLSPSGRKLASGFTAAFDLLASATQDLRHLAPNPEIHIAALPSIAQLWLPPRLGKLRKARPDINISVTAMEHPPSLTRELYDLSVFFAVPGDNPDQVVLAEDVIFPVSAPALTDKMSLADAPLIHDQTWQDDWQTWSRATATPIGDPTRGPRYSLYSLAVEESKAGAGVLIGHHCLVEEALSSGQLEKASDKSCATGRALVIDLPHRSRRHPELPAIVRLLSAKD